MCSEKKLYYFDNAATTWPKPEAVYQVAQQSLRNAYGNPGRTGNTQTLEGERRIYATREKLAHFLNAESSSRIVFTMNATDALNMAIKGLLKPGDHVLFTAMEHNSVLRPLGGMEKAGLINTTTIHCSKEGHLDLDYLASSIQDNTRLIACIHASNVTGTILPVEKIIQIAHRRGIKVLIDAAQTIGVIPVDVQALQVDMLAFAGHKGLLGPPGTGGLYVREGLDLSFWREGGTGSFSESALHPENMPERLEAGTLNITGIAALAEGIKFIREKGLANIRQQEKETRQEIWDNLFKIPGIRLYGTPAPEESINIISFSLDGIDCGEMGYILENNYNILCRTGLHCSPLAHKALGTFPAGTVRISPGIFTKTSEVAHLIAAISEISATVSAHKYRN